MQSLLCPGHFYRGPEEVVFALSMNGLNASLKQFDVNVKPILNINHAFFFFYAPIADYECYICSVGCMLVD